MPRDNSQNQTRTESALSSQLRLLQEAAIGHLDELECPSCRHSAVSVWFSHPAADMYRTWFICAECEFHARVQNTDRPRCFSEDRVSTELEERDLSIVRQAIFKKPPRRLM
jgi:hypothetical protein